MSVMHNLIAWYRTLSRKQKLFTIGVAVVASLALLNWLQG